MACSTSLPHRFARTKPSRVRGRDPMVMPALAARVDAIEPFYVMELMKEAHALERAGRDIIHMSVGQPDFTAPPPVVEAAVAAMQSGRTHYTAALGIEPLRAAISRFYRDTQQLEIDPSRVIVTAGASAALLLACTALVD